MGAWLNAWFLAGLSGLLLAASYVGTGEARDFPAASILSDPELARTRGGFTTPDGVDVAIGVQMDTYLNGKLILRSMLVPGGAPDALKVYAPAVAIPPVSSDLRDLRAGDTETRPVSTDGRSPSGTGGVGPKIVAGPTTADGNGALQTGRTETRLDVTYAVSRSPTSVPGRGDETVVAVKVDPSQGSLETGSGRMRVDATPRGPAVILDGDDLQARHLLGASANIVANTGNDRAIDTSTTIGISLSNASAVNLGSLRFRIEDAALSAASRLMR